MFSSISLFASANAGELTVSGTAKATYNIQSGKTNAGKGLGITNELNLLHQVKLTKVTHGTTLWS